MPDIDVQPVRVTSPPAAALPFIGYPVRVAVRNNGIHPATASGLARIYNLSTGQLIFDTLLLTGEIPPGGELEAVGDTWTPLTPGQYAITATVTTPLDQVRRNDNLGPATITVAPPPPPPPPPKHGNLYHEPAMATEANLTGHTEASAPHTGHESLARKGTPNGYAPLDADAKVPAEFLPPTTPAEHGNESHTSSFMVWRGTWDSVTSYTPGNLAITADPQAPGLFVCLAANIDKVPQDWPDYWASALPPTV